jgi:uncharacterized protein YqgC (DUF456 family)
MKLFRGVGALCLMLGALVAGCVDPAPHPSTFGYLFALALLVALPAVASAVVAAFAARDAGGAGRDVAIAATVGGVLGALPCGLLLVAGLGLMRRAGMTARDLGRAGAWALGWSETGPLGLPEVAAS